MNLICFPGPNPLPDLALTLHPQPQQIWLAQVEGLEDRATHLANLYERHGFDVAGFALPPFARHGSHADILFEALGPRLETAGSHHCVLALGDAAGPWELICQQVLIGLLAAEELEVVDAVEGARRVARLVPKPATVTDLPSVLTPADYPAASDATLRRSASDERAFEETVQARRTATLTLARESAALGSAL